MAQQVSAVGALLILPNILTASAFSETVFIAVVTSFIALADLGLSQVYSRIVPAMSYRGEGDGIAHWDKTIYGFGLLTSLVFSAGVSASYFVKFGSILHSMLLLPVAPLVFLTSFYVTRASCLGDFVSYRRMVIARAMLALAILPLVFLWGITGWFVGTLLAAFFLFLYSREVAITFVNGIDWKLVRENLGEGLMRCSIAVLWLQLLNVGRLYASANYSHEQLADYGIAASVYQSLGALVIAAFLPIGVETLRKFGNSKEDAMRYVHSIGEGVAPWVLLGTILVTEISPPIFRIVFPAYQLDPAMQASLLSGIIFYPFFIIWGNCLVGARRFASYIGLILFGLATAWLVAAYFGSDTRGASIGQFIGLMVYSFSMYLVIPKVLDVPFRLWLRAMCVFVLTVGLGAAYWAIRW